MSWLSSLSFGAPFILAGLAVLPVIWWLIRVTPPGPRRAVFPPLRILIGLRDEQQTPSRTPWWLMALRMLAAALVIVALAGPLIGENRQPAGNGPLVLFIDNGWTAAHAWDKRAELIDRTLRDAARKDRPVAIVTTADTQTPGLMDAGAAARRGREIAPQPWRGNRAAAAAQLAKLTFPARPEILWLSDGVMESTDADTAAALSRIGDLRVFDEAGNGPLALLPPENEANGIALTVIRTGTDGARSGQITALNARGGVLGSADFAIADGRDRASAHLRLPLQVRNEAARFAIAGDNAAGSVQLSDAGSVRPPVGLVSTTGTQTEQPLLSDLYYLERALSPYAGIEKGSITDLIAHKVSVLILADIGKVAGADRDAILRFLNDGGVLVRFAGERMAAESDDLVPVKLRTGGRYLGGAMGWATPQALAPFPDNSPFSGLAIPDDVSISRQILAEPGVGVSDRTWARLDDGTPLVTAENRGRGYLILFHTSASPSWSNLPLSGLFVGMLRRILLLAHGAHPAELTATASLAPVSVLDGFGRLHAAGGGVEPIRSGDMDKTVPSEKHPPGLYGTPGAEVALNTVAATAMLRPLDTEGLAVSAYDETGSIDPAPWLLALALLLALGDAMISLVLRGYARLPRKWLARGAGLGLALLFMAHGSGARADDAFDMKASLETRLAYVITGAADTDAMSRAGLDGLNRALRARTSYEAGDAMGVDLERDELSFFPLLYWPMDPRQKNLSPKALAKVGDYLRNGGTILFDTRDLTLGATRDANSPGQQTLRRLTAGLDLPPIAPIPSDHVLTKTFYLLQNFPGRWDGGTLWVEALPPAQPGTTPTPARGGDGVSPIIIGGNDWAAAWAVDDNGTPLVDVTPGGQLQREMAYRFGVNVVMYTLTGNYKADQVHVPALLQRLGK